MAILLLVGTVLEIVCMAFLTRGNGFRPTFIFSLLIILLAVTRWGPTGLVLAPILTMVTWLSGKYLIDTRDIIIDNEIVKIIYYDWEMLLAMMLGNLSIGWVALFFKKKKTTEIYSTYGNVVAIAAIAVIVVILIEIIVNLILVGIENANLFRFIIYNFPGIIFTLILPIALRSQGIWFNVKEKLLADRQQALEDAEYERQYLANAGRESTETRENESKDN